MRLKMDTDGLSQDEREQRRSEKKAIRCERKRRRAAAKDARREARRERFRQCRRKVFAWCGGKIDHMVPPGFEWQPVLKWTAAGLAICTLISIFRFGGRYGEAWRSLEWVSKTLSTENVMVERPIGVPMGESPWFFWTGKISRGWQTITQWIMVVKEGDTLPSFSWVMEGVMAPFVYLMIILLLLSVLHYLYYYHESKSIYVMKRLPNRMEIHRRSFALPLTMLVVCLVTVLLLTVIYFGIYHLFVPDRCVEPGQWERFFREGIFSMWRGDGL